MVAPAALARPTGGMLRLAVRVLIESQKDRAWGTAQQAARFFVLRPEQGVRLLKGPVEPGMLRQTSLRYRVGTDWA